MSHTNPLDPRDVNEIPLFTDLTANDYFEIEISDFLVIKRNIKNGQALRFTVTWKLPHPKYGLLGMSQIGWMCTRNYRGVLRVSPPISRFGSMQSKQLTTITHDFNDLLLSMITKHKTKDGRSYVDLVGNVLPDPLKAKRPGEVDEAYLDLPEEVRG